MLACSLTRDDGELPGAVFVPRDALCLLHEQSAEAAVLELARVPRRHRHHAPVHVQLAHHRHAALQLRPEKGGKDRLNVELWLQLLENDMLSRGITDIEWIKNIT